MKTLKLTDNERVELEDLQFAVDTALHDAANIFGDSVLLASAVDNASADVGYIINGFAMTNPSAKLFRVTRGPGGRAMLGFREDGVVKRGAIINDGDETITLDLAAYAQATYKAFLRAERIPTDTANRIFWNPAEDVEVAGAAVTRFTDRWSIRVESSSPGAEWLEVGTVVVGASSLTLTDKRPFFFEGRPDQNFEPQEFNRGDTRSGTGIGLFDLRSTVRALQKQIAMLMDVVAVAPTHNWWDSPVEGLAQKVSRFGDLLLAGNYAIVAAAGVGLTAVGGPDTSFGSSGAEFLGGVGSLGGAAGGDGVRGTGGAGGASSGAGGDGVQGQGGVGGSGGSGGSGLKGTGALPGGPGVEGIGAGSGAGGVFTAGATGRAITATGGSLGGIRSSTASGTTAVVNAANDVLQLRHSQVANNTKLMISMLHADADALHDGFAIVSDKVSDGDIDLEFYKVVDDTPTYVFGYDSSLAVFSPNGSLAISLGRIGAEWSRLHANGIVTPPASVAISTNNALIPVGNNSYIKLTISAGATGDIGLDTPTGGTDATGQRLTVYIVNTPGGAGTFSTAGANLVMAGTFTPTQLDTISFIWEGAAWVETGRSTNT